MKHRSENAVAATGPTILLTGFGPFPGIGANATAEFVPELAQLARARFQGHDVIDAVLPVEWERTPQLLTELLAQTHPVLALHFGVAKAASRFQIERVGRNACAPRHDAIEAFPACEQVIASGPDVLPSTLPVEAILTRLARAGVPCCTSDDAGGYLCNTLLYHSLTAAGAHPTPFLSGFVHLPAALARAEAAPDVGLTWDIALLGGIETIAACLETKALAAA